MVAFDAGRLARGPHLDDHDIDAAPGKIDRQAQAHWPRAHDGDRCGNSLTHAVRRTGEEGALPRRTPSTDRWRTSSGRAFQRAEIERLRLGSGRRGRASFPTGRKGVCRRYAAVRRTLGAIVAGYGRLRPIALAPNSPHRGPEFPRHPHAAAAIDWAQEVDYQKCFRRCRGPNDQMVSRNFLSLPQLHSLERKNVQPLPK